MGSANATTESAMTIVIETRSVKRRPQRVTRRRARRNLDVPILEEDEHDIFIGGDDKPPQGQ